MIQKLLAPLWLLMIFTMSLQAAEAPQAPAPTEQQSLNEADLDKLLESKNIGRPSIINDGSYWSEFINMLFVLAGIIVVLLVAGWFLKRVLRTRMAHVNFSSSIKILDKRALHPKACIYLLEVGGKHIVVGEGQNPISVLAELPKPEKGSTPEEDSKKGGFGQLFKSHLNKKSEAKV